MAKRVARIEPIVRREWMEPPHLPTEKSAAYRRQTTQKVPFSGAAEHANEPAGAGYFGDLSGEPPETGLVGGARWIRTLGSACFSAETLARITRGFGTSC